VARLRATIRMSMAPTDSAGAADWVGTADSADLLAPGAAASNLAGLTIAAVASSEAKAVARREVDAETREVLAPMAATEVQVPTPARIPVVAAVLF
jgi:hypothetical protein